MRTRLLLVTVMMLTAACRLSDHQQFGVGILKFAATTITSATTTPANVETAAPAPKQAPVTMTCAQQHRLQHMHSRLQRVLTRVIRVEMIASGRSCPKVRQSALRG